MDLQVAFNGTFFDLSLGAADLSTDAGLYSAVVISLFTDRRASAGDVPPGCASDVRGWWGDSYPPSEGDRIGSRLWLLGREKSLPDVARKAEQYAAEALQWMIDDGIVARVAVDAQIQDVRTLALSIAMARPSGDVITYRFANLWEALHAL